MALPRIDRTLINLAQSRVKRAFVPSDVVAQQGGGGAPPGGPPGGDPSMGGGGPPPMDPSMGGGGGPPPMDPSMMGGGGGGPPPMDPAMMGGGAPPPPPTDGGSGADIDSKVQNAVQKALQGAGLQGNQGPKQPKPDINTIATDLFQLKKMFLAYLRRQGIELPPDILDGPNRDPATGAPAVSPTGGSDVAPGASQAGGSIPPIQPIQPAMINAISGGGGGGKQANDATITKAGLIKAASDVLRLYSIYREHTDEDLPGFSDYESEMAKQAEADEAIYTSRVGPGVPYQATEAKKLGTKAAAISKIFRMRRRG